MSIFPLIISPFFFFLRYLFLLQGLKEISTVDYKYFMILFFSLDFCGVKKMGTGLVLSHIKSIELNVLSKKSSFTTLLMLYVPLSCRSLSGFLTLLSKSVCAQRLLCSCDSQPVRISGNRSYLMFAVSQDLAHLGSFQN